jgi:hypothetical protein
MSKPFPAFTDQCRISCNPPQKFKLWIYEFSNPSEQCSVSFVTSHLERLIILEPFLNVTEFFSFEVQTSKERKPQKCK